MPKSACSSAHFLLFIVFLTMGMNSPAKPIQNVIHKQPFEVKKWKYEPKFLLLIVFLTMGMNSQAKTIRK